MNETDRSAQHQNDDLERMKKQIGELFLEWECEWECEWERDR